MAQDLIKLNKDELKQFLNSFDHVLCDCDGVLFISYTVIEGAPNAIAKLKSLGKQIGYVTNNCSISCEGFAKHISSFGINVQTKDVIQPTHAIISYLKRINFNKKIYAIGFTPMRDAFIDAGFELADYGPSEDIKAHGKIIAPHLVDDLDIGAVVFDFDTNMNFIRLQKALTYLKRPDVIFLMGCTDIKVPFAEKFDIMGPGPFQNIIENMSGRTAIKFGKPAKELNDYANSYFNANPQRTLFIGDSFSDMVFGSEGGYQKLLVFSGIVKKQDMENCKDPNMLPDYYLNSLGDLNELLS